MATLHRHRHPTGNFKPAAGETLPMMRVAARRRLPRFAFEYLDGGAGDDAGIAQLACARCRGDLPALRDLQRPAVEIELFGRRYAADCVAPMGSPSVGFPGADRALAAAAQMAQLPYAQRGRRHDHRGGPHCIGRALVPASPPWPWLASISSPALRLRPRADPDHGYANPYGRARCKWGDHAISCSTVSAVDPVLTVLVCGDAQARGSFRFASFQKYAAERW